MFLSGCGSPLVLTGPDPVVTPSPVVENCTVTQTSTGATVICPDGTTATISNGANGTNGSNGATGATGATGAQGIPGVNATPSPTPSVTAVQAIVDNYNAYLVSVGNDPITPGLKCTLYNVPNIPSSPCLSSSSITGCTQLSTTTGYSSVASWTYVGTFNEPNVVGTAGLNILPKALQSLYTSNYAVTCTGYFVNPDYGYHEFDTTSDDGSLLYINGGSPVVNNDGEHSNANVSGQKYLQAQVYSFQLNYFQGPGYISLVVNEDGNLLPSAQLYH